jgi:hypothetical protein
MHKTSSDMNDKFEKAKKEKERLEGVKVNAESAYQKELKKKSGATKLLEGIISISWGSIA